LTKMLQSCSVFAEMAEWDNIKSLAAGNELPPAIIIAEPMQIAFLDGFYGQKESLAFVFHGGTAIRMLYGGYRYSEDLDFCVPDEKSLSLLDNLVTKAYQHAKELIAVYLGVMETELRKQVGRKKIATWWFNVMPPDERRKYRVKIEFGSYPVYTKKTLPVKNINKFLPKQPLVISTGPDELLADKINALADRPYTKERDFFDIWFLTTVLKVSPDIALIKKKMKDYRVNNAKAVLEKRILELDAERLAENMTNFLPIQHRRMLSVNGYGELIDSCRKVMTYVLQHL